MMMTRRHDDWWVGPAAPHIRVSAMPQQQADELVIFFRKLQRPRQPRRTVLGDHLSVRSGRQQQFCYLEMMHMACVSQRRVTEISLCVHVGMIFQQQAYKAERCLFVC